MSDFQLSTLFQLLLFTSVIGLVISYFMNKTAPKLGLMDDPQSAEHKLHKTPIPLT